MLQGGLLYLSLCQAIPRRRQLRRALWAGGVSSSLTVADPAKVGGLIFGRGSLRIRRVGRDEERGAGLRLRLGRKTHGWLFCISHSTSLGSPPQLASIAAARRPSQSPKGRGPHLRWRGWKSQCPRGQGGACRPPKSPHSHCPLLRTFP